MFNVLTGTFLILVATSAAVTGSIIVLALFDLAFGKKSTLPVVADIMEGDQLKPLSKPKSAGAGSKPKVKSFVAPGGGYRAKLKAEPGYGPDAQRMIHLG